MLLISEKTKKASAVLVILTACRSAKSISAVPECSCVPCAPTAYDLAFPREQACQGTNHVVKSSHVLSQYSGHVNHVWTVPATVLPVGTGMLCADVLMHCLLMSPLRCLGNFTTCTNRYMELIKS